MSRYAAVAAALLVGAVASACGDATPPEESRGDGRLVMVSGRDDHGLLADDEVPVYDAAEGAHVVGRIPDATLVTVVDRVGQWLEVRTVEGSPVQGWADDFHLRGELRLVGPAPDCASTVGGQARPGGTLVTVWAASDGRVLVETVSEPVSRGWAPRADVQELPPQGAACGEDPPGQRHRH